MPIIPKVMRRSVIFFFFLLPAPHSTFAAPTLPEVQTYDQLLHAIREVRSASQQRIERTVDQEKVREAWETGQLIHIHVLHHQERADYGEQVIIRLAKDLRTNPTELSFCLQFYRAYPIHWPANELSWSHHQAILALNDPKEMKEVAKEAVRRGWNRDQTREEVRRRKNRAGVSEEPESLEPIKPGILNTYQIFKQDGKLKIDLGFDTYFDLPKLFEKKVKAGDIVAFEGSRTKTATLNDLYTYQAKVLQTVDGDTFYALIDLGFGVSLHQRLRIRRLDAPEILSSEGKKAKAVLEKILARAKGPVVLKISKTDDQYGRYLADTWVNGRNIDQELLDTEIFQLRGDA